MPGSKGERQKMITYQGIYLRDKRGSGHFQVIKLCRQYKCYVFEHQLIINKTQIRNSI